MSKKNKRAVAPPVVYIVKTPDGWVKEIDPFDGWIYYTENEKDAHRFDGKRQGPRFWETPGNEVKILPMSREMLEFIGPIP